ncbi:recombinase family protein [Halocynthiibacter sp. C4]|uniref:recombinase family protein n=1 Tax=Halocynthiibacter sp. C4 TaxID=2992758 RepID=UPI00237B9344|nr:recombinase family protein [Halocynthiibacter sp. C4]MDE0589075.1 recombinase family protein [Halocynthiibacter sp. C4]
MTVARKIRCAIYTRKSSEEGLDQDFNSLDAQHEACAAYVASQKHEGWKLLPSRYDDGGKSGGSLERPALQRLLKDIEAGKIDMVVIYKIDRLTRSLSDFAQLVDRFEEVNCSFVSVTQAFNTSSSMGRLTLNVLLSFAQFEREVTAKRIRDKISASKKKGLWMGGVAPLGYEAHPDNTRRELVVNEAQAKTVQQIFTMYEDLGCLNAVMRQARKEGLVSKRHVFATGRAQGGKPFSRGQIYHILRNPTYLGRIRHKDKSYPGQHAAIIDQSQWGRVQGKLEAAAMRRRGLTTPQQTLSSQNGPAPLLGKFRDETGDILTPTHTQKGTKRHGYYVSNRLISGSPDRTGWRLPAKSFESLVAKAIAAHLATNAKRHTLLDAADAVAARAASEATQILADRIITRGAAEVAPLIRIGKVRNDNLQINLSRNNLAQELAVSADLICAKLLQFETSFTCRRRGAEMRIVAAEYAPAPDQTLIRALNNAHSWVGQMKSGISVKAIANKVSVSDSYVMHIIPLAFLSPKIQEAILNGTHPIEMTLETITRTKIPMAWRAQETLFGLAQNS